MYETFDTPTASDASAAGAGAASAAGAAGDASVAGIAGASGASGAAPEDPKTIIDATNQIQGLTEAIQNMEDIINEIDPVRKAIQTEQAVALQHATVSQQMFDAARGAEQAGVTYERAKQLEASGEHIAQLQERVLQRNKQALGGMNADIMTAKRVATISQQNTIYANNVSDYLQTSIIFLCVAIVIMFGFGMGMSVLKGVMAHPVVLMQALLILLATVYVILMLYKVITNWNHYRMLYQERVFPLYKFEDEVQTEECECPEAKVVAVEKADEAPKDPCADDDVVESVATKESTDATIEADVNTIEKAEETSNTNQCQTAATA